MKKILLYSSLFLYGLQAKAAVSVTNPLGNITDIPSLSGRIIAGILGVVGAISLVMFVWGGFLWLTSGGNADRIQKGKITLTWSTIGLLVIFASYALTRTVLDALAG